MKQYVIFISICLLLLSVPIDAKDNDFTYKIYMDSECENDFEVKEEVLLILDYLCEEVESESYYAMVKDNLSYFKKIEKAKVKLKNQTLILTIGDGKGSYVKGKYKKRDTCFEKVELKSALLEMFE